MTTITNTHRLIAAAAALATLAVPSGCVESNDTAAAPQPSGATPNADSSDVTATGATTATTSKATIPVQTAPPTTVDESWKEQAAAFCSGYLAAPPPPNLVMAGIVAHVAAYRESRDRLPSPETMNLPEQLRAAPTDVVAVWRESDGLLAAAEIAAAGDDISTALTSVSRSETLLQHVGALMALGGAECGDPARAANAALHVSLGDVHSVVTGFGSVWAGPWFGTSIRRVDPESGDVLATIDVGAPARRMHAADGRLIVRTTDAYVAVDPVTNTVVAALPKSDVGAFADRAAAVDGALWICDAQRLHRYDLVAFQPSAPAIELGQDCGSVYATPELVVAFSYNEEMGESGTSVAAFIDPVTNQVLATTSLPSDVTVPVVLDDIVFFPAQLGKRNIIVDRTTWTVTATPDYGRQIGAAGGAAFDGRSIYLIADGVDVLVIDPTTYELTDTIEPLTFVDRINAIAVGPGALWVATGSAGILERFDLPS